MNVIKILILALLIPAFCFSQSQERFYKYTLKGVGNISVPDDLELQSGDYKNKAEKFQKSLGNELDENRVVFQNIGTNNSLNKRLPSYEKIIFETKISQKGDYKKITSKETETESELYDLGNMYKSQLENVNSILKMNLIAWYGAVNTVVNYRNAIKISYIRQLNENEPLVVDMYIFQNYDRVHTLTICYRQSQSEKWKSIFEKVVNSFTITVER